MIQHYIKRNKIINSKINEILQDDEQHTITSIEAKVLSKLSSIQKVMHPIARSHGSENRVQHDLMFLLTIVKTYIVDSFLYILQKKKP